MYQQKCQENTFTFLRWQIQKTNQARETQQPMASSNDDSQNQNQMPLQRQAQQMANQGQQQTAQQVSQLQTGNHLPLQMTGQNEQGLNPMAGNMFQRNFPLSRDTSPLAMDKQGYIQSQQLASAQQQQQQRTQQQLQAQQQNLPQQQQTPQQLQQAALLRSGQQFNMTQANQAGLNKLNASNIYGQQQQQAGPHQAYAANLAAQQRQASQNGLSNLNQPINTSMEGQQAQQTLQQRTAQFPQMPDALKDASAFNQQARNPLQSPAQVQMQRGTLTPGEIEKMGKDIATYRFYMGLVKQREAAADTQPHLKEQYDQAITKFQLSRSTNPDLLDQIRAIHDEHTNFLRERRGYKLAQPGNDAFQTAQMPSVQQTNLVQQRLKQQQFANNQQIALNLALEDSGTLSNQMTPVQIHLFQRLHHHQQVAQLQQQARTSAGDSATSGVLQPNNMLPQAANPHNYPIPPDSQPALMAIGVPLDKLMSWNEVINWLQDAFKAGIVNEEQYEKVRDEYHSVTNPQAYYQAKQLQARKAAGRGNIPASNLLLLQQMQARQQHLAGQQSQVQ